MKKKIDKTPARLDFIQSSTGLILAVFIMGHILFESSILISNEFMYKVTIMFEGYYFFGETYPGIVSFLAGAIFVIFISHAAVAMRKFPSKYKQYKIMKNHAMRMNHEDTTLWIIQVVTGFVMFFIGSVHLYMMITQASNIGPYASSNRVYDEMLAPLYALLLFSVIPHAFIGLYRLAVKWGFMEGSSSKKSRSFFKLMMRILIVVYLGLGISALYTYIQIGKENDFAKVGKYKSKTIHLENH